MASPEIVVFAIVTAKSGKSKEVLEVLHGLIEPSRAEAGCIGYNLHQDDSNKDIFVFYEIWNSSEDLDKHEQSSHYRAAGTRLSELVESIDVKRTFRVDP